MAKKYNNHSMHTNPFHREEETQSTNSHMTSQAF